MKEKANDKFNKSSPRLPGGPLSRGQMGFDNQIFSICRPQHRLAEEMGGRDWPGQSGFLDVFSSSFPFGETIS